MPSKTTLNALAALTLLASALSAQSGGSRGGGAQQGGDPGDGLTPQPGDVLESSDTRPDGSVRQITGRIATDGADLESRAGDFLRDYGAAFGVEGDVELRAVGAPKPVALPGSPVSQQMRLEQTVHGHVLLDHGMVLDFDDSGDVRRAHGVVSRESPGSAPLVRREDAAELALDAVGWDRADLRADPVVRALARVQTDRIELLFRVEVIRGLIPWAIEIDARDGSLLRVFQNSTHGQGTLIWDEEEVAFTTGQGVGNVYKGVKAAKAEAEGSTALKQLGVGDIGEIFADGTLTGRFTQIVNADGLQLVNGAHDFRFLDDSPTLVSGVIEEYQLFDHANTFYWLTRAGVWFANLQPFAGDHAVLAYVNYDDGGDGYVNAFYTPADPDGEGVFHDPGYFVFGEFTAVTGDPMDDLSRDPTIAIHEYCHMVVDQDGHTFGDASLDWPPRAVNEGLADYAASSMLKTPLVGHAFMHHSGADIGAPGDSFRDLEAEVTMQDDLWTVVGGTTGLPEEHAAGEIFAAACWRAKQGGLKKAADQTVLGNLGEWPLSTAEVGYPTVTVGNATDAYEAYFYACFEAMADLAQGDGSDKSGMRQAVALLGAFMAHGITGASPSTTYTLDASGDKGLAARMPGAFLGSLDEHVFDLELAEGQTVKLAVKGVKGTLVDITLGSTDGGDAEPEELTVVKEKKVSPKGTSAVLPGVLVGTAGTYRVTVSHDGDGGAYKLLIKVK